jgi:hypothetical protein
MWIYSGEGEHEVHETSWRGAQAIKVGDPHIYIYIYTYIHTYIYTVYRKMSQRHSFMFRAVFWVVLPCKLIVDRRFSITQKTALNIILAAVRTWNLTHSFMLHMVHVWMREQLLVTDCWFQTCLLYVLLFLRLQVIHTVFTWIWHKHFS